MPEQITKYPEVTLEVLKGAGAVCGEGAPQKILKQCPRERFCALPTGEMCIYGVNEIAQMTQIEPQELAQVVAPKTRKCISGFSEPVNQHPRITQVNLQGVTGAASTIPQCSADPVAPVALSTAEASALGAMFVAGLALGKWWRKSRIKGS